MAACCGIGCKEQSGLAPGAVGLGSLYTILVYPFIWSLESDVIENKDKLADCSGYDHLYLWTTIGTIVGVIFYMSWCFLSFGWLCCQWCLCFDEMADKCWRKVNGRKVNFVELQEVVNTT